LSSDRLQDLTDLTREELAERLHNEVKAQSALTVFYDQSVGERLGLNPTDNKCLSLILKSAMMGHKRPEASQLITPGELARLTNLTTGAVTGVLDRLEEAGYVQREHDPDDRRRIIIRPNIERLHSEVEPIWDWMTTSFKECCSRYTEDELRLLIDFTLRAQELLKGATERIRDIEEPPPAV
jgi:DNA-binding MarR family transcriptional regulator